jgi:hypothetical protein
MRSLASALQLLTNALGSYVATAVTSIINSVTTANGSLGWLPDNLNQGRLDYYYVVLVVLSVLNVFFFIFVAHFYKYKKVRARGPAACSVCLEHLQIHRKMLCYTVKAQKPESYRNCTSGISECIQDIERQTSLALAWWPHHQG